MKWSVLGAAFLVYFPSCSVIPTAQSDITNPEIALYSSLDWRGIPPFLKPTSEEYFSYPFLLDCVPYLSDKSFEASAKLIQLERQKEEASILIAWQLWLLVQAGLKKEAEQLFNYVLANDIVAPSIVYSGAVYYEWIEDSEKALLLYNDLLEIDPRSVLILKACIRNALASNEPDFALECLNTLALIDSVNPQYLQWRAEAFVQFEMYEEALNLYKKVINEQSSNEQLLEVVAHKSFHAAVKAQSETIFIQTVDFLEKFLEANPQSARGHYELGVSYASLFAINEAIEAFSRCLELEPQHLDAGLALYDLYVAYNSPRQAELLKQELLRQPLSLENRLRVEKK